MISQNGSKSNDTAEIKEKIAYLNSVIEYLKTERTKLHEMILKPCVGCGIGFVPGRSDQNYHDAYCRGRANSRNTYHRKKEQGQLAQ
jgi:hypothetical protein